MYGDKTSITPNLDRLAKRSTIFDNHWCGSAPCVPARRDMFTGRLNFLERNWGGVEPFDITLPKVLREHKDIYSHIVTDHAFYVEHGGENYHTSFNSWEIIRGQEHDTLVPLVNKEEPPERIGLLSDQYNANRQVFNKEEDYPSPKTFQGAVDWLNLNKDAEEFFLWVEAVDPHEPFDTPQKYLDLYDDDYDDTLYFWPDYAPCTDTAKESEHIKNRYRATLTMMDHWLGKILDFLDDNNMWDDTAVVFTTDHGFMLGEHGFMAKNYMPAYNEVFHIPLLIHHPDVEGGNRVSSLTQNIDLFPTVLDFFDIPTDAGVNKLHGKSLLPLMKKETDKVRDAVIYGYYGLSVNVTDGKHTYFRAAKNPDNQPLNLYTAMPVTLRQYIGHDSMETFDNIEAGRFLNWTNYPVFKFRAQEIDYRNASQTFTVRSKYNSENLLFNIVDDYEQNNPINDEELENHYIKLLKETMEAHDSPVEQYERLGI